MTTIVWFRNDLRLADNPALAEAAARGPVVPVYVWAPEEEGEWPPGAASRWWLHRSLHALDRSLRERGSQLVVRRGPTNEALASLLRETGAVSVVWNRRYEPAAIARDTELKRRLPAAASFGAGLLREPWTVATRAVRSANRPPAAQRQPVRRLPLDRGCSPATRSASGLEPSRRAYVGVGVGWRHRARS